MNKEEKPKQDLVLKDDLPVMLQLDTKDVDAAVTQAEKWIELKNRIRQASLKMTLPDHWVDQNGRPYLEIGGAERIADGWGISITNSETSDQKWLEDSKGVKYYEIRAKVTAKFRGREYTQEGSATSKDKFFGRAQGRLKDECEVNISDIRKKALTNAMNRTIKSIVGLSAVTWDELEKVGIRRGTTKSVAYKDKSEAAQTVADDKKAPVKKEQKESETPKGRNWWTSEYKGKMYLITYNENSKLNHKALTAYGFNYNEEKRTYSREYSEEAAAALDANYFEGDGWEE